MSRSLSKLIAAGKGKRADARRTDDIGSDRRQEKDERSNNDADARDATRRLEKFQFYGRLKNRRWRSVGVKNYPPVRGIHR